MNIASWIASLVGPLVNRVLLSLGFGFISIYASLVYIKGQIDSKMNEYLGQLWPDVYSIAALAGFVDAIGIWLGALTAVITFMGLKRLASLA